MIDRCGMLALTCALLGSVCVSAQPTNTTSPSKSQSSSNKMTLTPVHTSTSFSASSTASNTQRGTQSVSLTASKGIHSGTHTIVNTATNTINATDVPTLSESQSTTTSRSVSATRTESFTWSGDISGSESPSGTRTLLKSTKTEHETMTIHLPTPLAVRGEAFLLRIVGTLFLTLLEGGRGPTLDNALVIDVKGLVNTLPHVAVGRNTMNVSVLGSRMVTTNLLNDTWESNIAIAVEVYEEQNTNTPEAMRAAMAEGAGWLTRVRSVHVLPIQVVDVAILRASPTAVPQTAIPSTDAPLSEEVSSSACDGICIVSVTVAGLFVVGVLVVAVIIIRRRRLRRTEEDKERPTTPPVEYRRENEPLKYPTGRFRSYRRPPTQPVDEGIV